MNEWQPVRIVPVAEDRKFHGKYSDDRGRHSAVQMKIIRVRPIEADAETKDKHQHAGCDAERFYVVLPEDALNIFGEWTKHYREIIMCEHQILAD